MAKCRGCGNEIRWITTVAGKHMPCEIKRIEPFEVDEGTLLIGSDGSTYRTGGTESPVLGVVYYYPHWSHCPSYKDFKEKKNAGK